MTRPRTARAADVWRGLGALTALVLLFVAVPVGLYVVGGSPIPNGLPTWSQVSGVLMRPDTDHSLFLGAVRLIGWAAWLLLVVIVIAEVIGYLAGRPVPRLPGPARPMQYLARDLVAMAALLFGTTATLTGPSTTPAAHAVPIAAAQTSVPSTGSAQETAPSPATSAAQPEGKGWRTRVIKRGDTLWSIARREYGAGRLYPRIFRASKNLDQPQGLPKLTDPDHIRPGQRIRIPHPADGTPPHQRNVQRTTPTTGQPQEQATGVASPTPTDPAPDAVPPTQAPSPQRSSHPPSTPVTSPPADHGQTSAPQRVDSERNDAPPFTATLSTGTHVGIGLATAISIAIAAARLQRRRRRTYGDTWPNQPAPEPVPPAAAAKVRKAHLDTYADQNEPIPTDTELVEQDLATPAPDRLTLGVRDGHEVTVPLAGLGLGLDGPGALNVARAIATELLAKSHRDRATLIIPEQVAKALFPKADLTALASAKPGLVITPTPAAAITHLETETIHRARLLDNADQPNVAALRAADPSEPLPTLVVITPEPSHALHALIQLGSRYAIAAIVLGPWPAATTLHITDDGTTTQAQGPHADALTGTRLFKVTEPDAHDLLRTLCTAHSPDDEPAPIPAPRAAEPTPSTPATPGPAQTDEHPVKLHVLGPVRLEAASVPINTGLRRSARELLAYLALHPNGATREQVTAALWPDRDPETTPMALHTAINNIRKVLRQAIGLREPMFVIHASARYRLDPHLIDVDLWRLETTLAEARQAADDTDRIHALQPVATLYTADFATDLTHDWAEAHREHLRRTAIDALAHLAGLTQTDHPDQALAILEQALNHDPYSEPLYQSVMRLQAQLGRSDAVRRTYQLLATRLAALDAEPDDQTHQLLDALLHRS
ncbi:BTAD domain-containing putative transcriptional regulator [Thermomonospora cellulosilytica]|uniref:DNA-binding SARP family transcriptional activator/LysM repeat protein n=1 Tax=Thermomonospora cellulosilytica TaxID=1411118 RepID=A0A7W3R7Z6_9ACTN|nr:BTAD domain-containing putative transcriptional regulator [Thermomonospora cellulosilytica]MBA9003044.1 DNA-binding SARP family transcriptional activator/LysM repeat protein [Thermomonospora cellulosilytica]